MTNLYIDTEFTSLTKDAKLLSLAIISDEDHVFYAEFIDYPADQLSEFVINSVMKNMFLHNTINEITQKKVLYRGFTSNIKELLISWLAQFKEVKMVGDVLSYDWVLFCDLFGGALSIPKNVYYIPADLSTLMSAKGVDPDMPRHKYMNQECVDAIRALPCGNTPHNALVDAYQIRSAYKYMISK